MFCQLNHLLDALMFDLCSTGAGKPRAGGVCKYRASLSFQARAGLAGEVAASETEAPSACRWCLQLAVSPQRCSCRLSR